MAGFAGCQDGLIGAQEPGRDDRPAEGGRCRFPRPLPEPAAKDVVFEEPDQGSAQTHLVGGWDEHATSIRDELAIPVDVGGNYRRRRGERPGKDHAKALAPERGCGEHLRTCELTVEVVWAQMAEQIDPLGRNAFTCQEVAN